MVTKFALALGIITLAMPQETTKPKDAKILVTPYTAPHLGFKVTQGLVSHGEIIYCTPGEQTMDYKDHKDRLVTLECEQGVKLVLDDVLFDASPKIALKVENSKQN